MLVISCIIALSVFSLVSCKKQQKLYPVQTNYSVAMVDWNGVTIYTEDNYWLVYKDCITVLIDENISAPQATLYRYGNNTSIKLLVIWVKTKDAQEDWQNFLATEIPSEQRSTKKLFKKASI